jgi:ribosomal-protein-alanine N-acetyltransferase
VPLGHRQKVAKRMAVVNNLIIRKMEPEDLNDVLTIETLSSLNPWSKNLFLRELETPRAFCFVIEREMISKPRVLGFICFRNIGDESEILELCVHPEYRQMGIGARLMEFYISFCKEMMIKMFYLEVNILNRSAVHLYRKFSYQSFGMRKKFYQGKFDALLMAKKA